MSRLLSEVSVVMLISGNGGTLKFINQFQRDFGLIKIKIAHVIADRDCKGLEYAKLNNIDNSLIQYDRNNIIELYDKLIKLDPDLIITNIFKILDSAIVERFSTKLINFHYSLLPAFKGHIGTKTIVEARDLGCRFIGSTCHVVDEKVDSGKILAQCVFELRDEDSISVLENVMFRSNCIMALNLLISLVSRHQSENFTQLSILNKKVNFSPALIGKFDSLGESFWDKVASA